MSSSTSQPLKKLPKLRGTAAMAGGMRKGQGNRRGPSKALAKQYKIDDKERKKRAEKMNSGNSKRNDTTMEAVKGIGMGVAGIIIVFAIFFKVVRHIRTTPAQAAEAFVNTVMWVYEEYGFEIVIVAGVAGVGGAAYGMYTRIANQASEAKRIQAEIVEVQNKRTSSKARKKKASATRAERTAQRVTKQLALIRVEEQELERIKALNDSATEEEKQRWLRIEDEATKWDADDQRLLDEAIVAVPASSFPVSAQQRWEAVSNMIPNRSPEECLARVRYCRQQAQLQAQMDQENELDDSMFANDSATSAAPNYVNWYKQQYNDDFDDEDDDESETSEDDDDDREKLEIELNPTRKGTLVKLDGVQLWRTGTQRVSSLKLQLECLRCQTGCDMTLSGEYVAECEDATYCKKCSTLLRCALRPLIMHETAPEVGFLDCTACKVIDVLPSTIKASCIDCNEDVELPPLRRGVRLEKTCMHCHHKIALEAKYIRIEEITPPRVGGMTSSQSKASTGAKKKGSSGAGPRVVAGQPLPDNGACKHFKKSLRWLRFPCCGKAWPCPVCHEVSGCEGAMMGVLANRMICGKCSNEENFANSNCGSCKFHMGNKRGGGAHWSGGGGTRDTGALSRKDHRKNQGVSRTGALKTASKKNARVGTAGKTAIKHKMEKKESSKS